MTYKDSGGVDTGEDSERTNADDIVVKQRGAGLIVLDGPLKLEIPAMIREGLVSDADYNVEERTCRGYRWQWTLRRR